MVRNITLSADDELIAKARKRAAAEHRTLNAIFREWLAGYATAGRKPESFRQLMKKMKNVRVGHFTREQLHER